MANEWVFGIHAVDAVIEKRRDAVQQICIQKGRNDQKIKALESRARGYGLSVVTMAKHEIEQRVKGNHQGVIAEVAPARELDEADLEQLVKSLAAKKAPPFFLVLDGVTDPHNLGACVRTANAAGAHAVIYPKDKSAGLNATVRKVACGAADFTPMISVTNLARTLKWLKQCGIWVVGAAGETEQAMAMADFTGPLALVMGSEGKGMRRLTRENCDQLVKIPMQGEVESLNVSVATGVLLYEAYRQRYLARLH